MTYLSQSDSHEALSSNLPMSRLPERWMASATVYLVFPIAHLSILGIQRSDWRKRWSRLSDNNRGSCRTLEGGDTVSVILFSCF